MRKFVEFSCVLVMMTLPTASLAQTEWLPADVMEALSQQLASNLRKADPQETVVTGDGIEMARAGIAGTVARIDSLGLAGVLAMTPDFPMLDLPSSGQPQIDSIMRWGICSFPVDAAYSDMSDREGGLQRRITAAAMSTSGVMISAFLRYHYLAAGLTDEDVRNFMANERLRSIVFQVRTNAQLLSYTMEKCTGPLSGLMQ